jgi:Folate-dependent phosphoribosylglycinamide formyltransferase PurN
MWIWKRTMKNIISLASGQGSNANTIIKQFKTNYNYNFPLIITNNPQAGVIQIAIQHGIPISIVDKINVEDPIYLDIIDYFQPDLIVLAGYLWKIPTHWINAYPGKIINIHPALLPKYGGKGMYGHHVHEAVIAAGEKESGISIHLVNEEYDEGMILLQRTVAISDNETASSLAAKVQCLEHEWYWQVIHQLLSE